MARKGYSTVFDAEKTAAARGVEVHCSPKASRNIMLAIKGMRLEDAKDFLDQVTRKEQAVPMRVRNRKIKHRKGGLGPGAYPVKAAERILRILSNAENNAEYKDLETDNLRVLHASAYRGETIAKFRPRAQGRATPSFEQTTNMEIILGEDEGLDEREEAREERRARGGRPAKKAKAATKRQSVGTPAKSKEADASESEKSEKEPEAENEKASAEEEPKKEEA
jgi:large subunit ribosomal protein L22